MTQVNHLNLSGPAYLIWVEMHHPHEPALEQLDRALQALGADDRRLALARARALVAYGQAVERALGPPLTAGAEAITRAAVSAQRHS